MQQIQLGPPNVFLPITRRVQNKRIGVAVAFGSIGPITVGVKFYFWFERESMRRASQMCTLMLIFRAKWRLFWSTARHKRTARETVFYWPVAGNFEEETTQCKICFTWWRPGSLNTKQTRHKCVLLNESRECWGRKRLNTKMLLNDGRTKEGQNKINISKTKIFKQDFRDPLIGNHWTLVTTCWQWTKRSFLISKTISRLISFQLVT